MPAGDEDSRYLTNEQLEAQRRAKLPWYKRFWEGCFSGCAIDLFVILLIVGVPSWWLL